MARTECVAQTLLLRIADIKCRGVFALTHSFGLAALIVFISKAAEKRINEKE